MELNVHPSDLLNAADDYDTLAARAALISPQAAQEVQRIAATHGPMGYPVAVGVAAGLAKAETPLQAKTADFQTYSRRFTEHANTYRAADAEGAGLYRAVDVRTWKDDPSTTTTTTPPPPPPKMPECGPEDIAKLQREVQDLERREDALRERINAFNKLPNAFDSSDPRQVEAAHAYERERAELVKERDALTHEEHDLKYEIGDCGVKVVSKGGQEVLEPDDSTAPAPSPTTP
jgi:hypothetical protein